MIFEFIAMMSATLAEPKVWARNDPNRPLPPIVEVMGPTTTKAPSDATVLFDSTNLDNWVVDTEMGWTVADGVLTTGGHTRNYMATKKSYGDIQIHLEFKTPSPAGGVGQKRGNSGIFLMGIYELQIMDPVDNPTFADGLPGSIYGQIPPLAYAVRAPGEWQSYDIIFNAPDFDGDKLVSPPTVTAFLNGVLVQHKTVIKGDTIPKVQPPEYRTRIEKGPLVLQDHGDATGRVQFRNIWLRELPTREQIDGQ